MDISAVTRSEVFSDFVHRNCTVTTISCGVHYYGYRYYNPDLGRWINRDPIGEKVFLEQLEDLIFGERKIEKESRKPVFLFIANNPISNYDVRGLLGMKPWDGKWHGNWCGGGWTGGKNQDAKDYDWENDPRPDTTTDLDKCCRTHDAAYAGYIWVSLPSHPEKYPRGGAWLGKIDPVDSYDRWKADKELCECAKKANDGGVDRIGIICIFCYVK